MPCPAVCVFEREDRNFWASTRELEEDELVGGFGLHYISGALLGEERERCLRMPVPEGGMPRFA